MKNWLLFAFFLPQFLTAQTERPHAQIGLVVGGESDYRLLFESKNSASGGAVKKVRDDNEKFDFGYRFGVDFMLPLRRFSLKMGLRFSQQGYILKNSKLIWPSEIMTGMTDPTLPHHLIFSRTPSLRRAANFPPFSKKG